MALLVPVAFALVGVTLGERSVAVGLAGMWRGRLLREFRKYAEAYVR